MAQRAQNGHFGAMSGSGGSKLGEECGTSMEQVRPYLGRCIGIRVTMLQRAKKHSVVIYGSGGFKLVVQCGTRWEQVRAHQVRCDETIFRVRNVHWEVHRPKKGTFGGHMWVWRHFLSILGGVSQWDWYMLTRS